MEQSPSREASSSSTSQEIPRILLSPKVSLQHSQDPFTYPILSQINPVHISPTHFLKIHFNIIIPSTPRSSKCYPSLRHPPKPCMHRSSPHTGHMPRGIDHGRPQRRYLILHCVTSYTTLVFKQLSNTPIFKVVICRWSKFSFSSKVLTKNTALL